jgi:hypothetical protein
LGIDVGSDVGRQERERGDRNPIVLDVVGVWFMLSAGVQLLTLRDLWDRGSLDLSADLIVGVVSIVLIGLVGIQTFRRRTFWLCVGITVALALVNGVALVTEGWPITIFSALFPAGLAAVIFTRRSVFLD